LQTLAHGGLGICLHDRYIPPGGIGFKLGVQAG
jgi:hypothetical protein